METSSSEKAKEFRALNEAKNQRVLEMLEKKRFGVSEVQIKTPEKAIIYPTRIFNKYGEGFMEPGGRVRNGKVVCTPCFETKK